MIAAIIIAFAISKLLLNKYSNIFIASLNSILACFPYFLLSRKFGNLPLISHALKKTSIPIVTIIGIGIALLIGGVVVTESVYNIPGLGRLVVDAILKRDYPIIQGLILMFSFVYIIINLVIAIVYTILDPRIRY